MSATLPQGKAGSSRIQQRLARLPVPVDVCHRYEFYRLLLSIPENRRVTRRDAFTPILWELGGKPPGLGSIARRARAAAFEEDLRLLHDVLASSEFAGRYWIWCGTCLAGRERDGSCRVTRTPTSPSRRRTTSDTPVRCWPCSTPDSAAGSASETTRARSPRRRSSAAVQNSSSSA